MNEMQGRDPNKRQKLVRPASSMRSMALETEPPTFNLSDILEALRPGHRRIILDELAQGLADGSLRAVPRKDTPPETEVETLRGRLHTRTYQDFRIQDTSGLQKWLQDRAVQCDDALFLREGIGQDTEAELDADPRRFERLALAYQQQCQDKARRKRKGKGVATTTPEPPAHVPYRASEDPTSAEYSPPYITPSKRKKTV